MPLKRAFAPGNITMPPNTQKCPRTRSNASGGHRKPNIILIAARHMKTQHIGKNVVQCDRNTLLLLQLLLLSLFLLPLIQHPAAHIRAESRLLVRKAAALKLIDQLLARIRIVL